MSNNRKIPERHTTAADSDDFWSLPREEAIAQLMREFDMSREEAEAVLDRPRTPYIRRYAVERLSEEEFNKLEAEASASPSVLTLSRKDLKKQSPDDTEHED